jgi:hypothetical protein
MQDDGQLKLTGDLQLGTKKCPLHFKIWMSLESVQSDFTHGHQGRVTVLRLQSVLQGLQGMAIATVHMQRMDAQGIKIVVALRQRLHRLPIVRMHSRDDAKLHAHLSSQLTLHVPIGVKL